MSNHMRFHASLALQAFTKLRSSPFRCWQRSRFKALASEAVFDFQNGLHV